jgi:nucleoside-diphosphate-sugar epimerase
MGTDDHAEQPVEGVAPGVHRSRGGRQDRPAPATVRSRRSAAGPSIGVVYAGSGLGRVLAAHLVADGARVVGLDVRRGDVPGVTWRVGDPAHPDLVRRLGGLDVLVHPAAETAGDEDRQGRAVRRVRACQTALTAAAAAGVPRVVVVTSAMVYGARPDNPVPLDEDAPLLAAPDDSVAGDLLEVEELVARARELHPGLTVTVVRPALVVGPGVDTFRTRHFAAPRLLVVKDTRPLWQFAHVDDVASAVAWSALGRVAGEVLTVGCAGYLTQEQVEEHVGLGRIELPSRVATATAERLHRIGVTAAPASDLAYSSWPWVVSSARLRAAGWRPAFDNSAALQVLLEDVRGRFAVGGRRMPAREAALGAAGTTVAVLSTAAVVRQVRRQRRGG